MTHSGDLISNPGRIHFLPGLLLALIIVMTVGCNPNEPPARNPVFTDSVDHDSIVLVIQQEAKQVRSVMGREHFDSAIVLSDHALLLAANFLNPDDTLRSKLLARKGFCHVQGGSIVKGLRCYREGLKSVLLRDHPSRKDSAEAGTLLANIAMQYARCAMPDSAIIYGKLALETRIRLYGKDSPSLIVVLQNLAESWKVKGDLDEAGNILNHVVNRLSIQEDTVQLSIALNNLADIYFLRDDSAGALELLNRSLAMIKPKLNKNTKVGYSIYSGLALAAAHSDPNGSGEFLDQAFHFAALSYPARRHREKGKLHLTEGGIRLLQHRPQEALHAYYTALLHFAPRIQSADDDCLPPVYMYDREPQTFIALCGMAHAREMMAGAAGMADSAYHCYLAAFRFADGLRRGFNTVEQKDFLSSVIFPEYERAIQMTLRQYRQPGNREVLGRIFELMEMSKANDQLDALNAVAATGKYTLPDSLVLAISKLDDSLHKVQGWLAGGDLGAATTVVALEKEKEQQQDWLKNHHPGYFFTEPVYADWSHTTRWLKGNDTLLLEYFLGEDELYVLAACGMRDTAFTVRWDSSSLAIYNAFQESIRPGQHAQVYPAFTTPSFALYQMLVQPALGICAGGTLPQRLFIVPDGQLDFIPFEALLTQAAKPSEDARSLPYLLRKSTVTYTHSLQLLLLTSSARAQQAAMLGMGTQLKLAKGMPPLANAAREAEMATDRMGGETALNEAATESAFRQRASAFNILHIASHSILDEGKPLESHILLHTDPATQDDGRINAWEVYDMKLGADLTVLSACSAGKGKNIKGQGVMSLGRAFSVAGCPNVIMTLNNVNDLAAYQLMDAFYAKLAEGLCAADALREARLTYLHDRDVGMTHPSLWAPFILSGPGDVQFVAEPRSKAFKPWFGGGLAVLLAVAGWFYMGKKRLRQKPD